MTCPGLPRSSPLSPLLWAPGRALCCPEAWWGFGKSEGKLSVQLPGLMAVQSSRGEGHSCDTPVTLLCQQLGASSWRDGPEPAGEQREPGEQHSGD